MLLGAMAMDGSYETKLMRLIIGFLHVTALEQISQGRHGTHFHNLSAEVRQKMQDDLALAVLAIAEQLSESAFELANGVPPIGTIH